MRVYKTYITFLILMLLFSCKANAQKDTIVTLSNITVSTGQFRPQTVKNSVYKVKVISQEQIQAKAATNLMQVLNTVAGINMSNDNTLGVTNIELMGMSGQSVKVLLDGIPIVDRNDVKESLSQVNIENIERIEIVEGPMSVLYGSDALAGVINIITKKQTGKHIKAGLRIQEETAGKEYSLLGNKGLHLQSVNASYGINAFFVNGGFTHNDFQGFGGDDYGRSKGWKPKVQYLGNILVGHKSATNTIYYRLEGLDETITSRGAINMGTFKAFDQRFITRRWLHQLQNDWDISSKFNLSSSLSYTDYNRRTKSTRHDFTLGTDQLTTGSGEQDTAKFNTLFFRTLGLLKMNDKMALQAGIEFSRNAASGARIEGSPVINDFSLFASAEWKLISFLNIRPGFRVVKNSLYDAPPIVPAISTKWKISEKLDMRLSYAHGFRAPALRELYFDFIDANHTLLGNKDLKAETSKSINGSLNWGYGQKDFKAMAIVSGFYNIFDNLIDYALDPTDNTTTRLFNVDKFKTTGFSVEQNLVYKQWQLNIVGLYIGRYNRLNNTSGTNIEVPTFNWSPELSGNLFYNLQKINTRFAFMYKYNGARKAYVMMDGNVSDIRLTKLDGYHWADFSVSKKFFKSISLQSGIKNIFNVNNINSSASGGSVHVSSGPRPISYGRSYFLSIQYSIQ